MIDRDFLYVASPRFRKIYDYPDILGEHEYEVRLLSRKRWDVHRIAELLYDRRDVRFPPFNHSRGDSITLISRYVEGYLAESYRLPRYRYGPRSSLFWDDDDTTPVVSVQYIYPPSVQVDVYSFARQEHAWLMRAEGETYDQIGVRLGVSRSRAQQMADRFCRVLNWSLRRHKTRWRIDANVPTVPLV